LAIILTRIRAAAPARMYSMAIMVFISPTVDWRLVSLWPFSGRDPGW
jgi:hypothetical protein